jgi:hypothetical protein
LKYCTVAKSVSVSIATIAAPAATAGRSIGSTTRRVASPRDAPSVRATIDAVAAWSRSAVRVRRYTYGYSVRVSVMIAPGIERTSGNHASRPNASRHHVCTGPATSNTAVVTNPRM